MHAKTLPEHAQAALAILSTAPILKSAYLAGGSALALHVGHRKSHDFDFYTRESVRAEDVARELGKIGNFKTTLMEPPHTLLGEFNRVKFSLFRYDYPLIDVISEFQKVKIAGVKDIAAMKLSAICGRATKRDYVDIFTISKMHSLEEQLKWYKKKFGQFGNNLYVIIKALDFFQDAEADEMPNMFTQVSWEEVKTFLKAESHRLAKKYLE